MQDQAVIAVTATVQMKFDVAAIRVSAEVRYWEDARINGEPDTDGSRTPLRKGECWEPTIDLRTGRVRDWPHGTTADVHFKVCDAGFYELLDSADRVVAVKRGYVPDLLSVGESGYGDYIILKIAPDEQIAKWKTPCIDPDDWVWNAIYGGAQ